MSQTIFLDCGIATIPAGSQTATISFGSTLSATPAEILLSFIAPAMTSYPIAGNVVSGTISTTGFQLFLDSVPADSLHSVSWTALGAASGLAPLVLGGGTATIPSGSQTATISFGGTLPLMPTGISISLNAPSTGSYPLDANVIAGTVTPSGFEVLLDSVPSDSSHSISWTALALVSGSGNVVGPASSTDGDIALFNGTTGTLLKDTGLSASSFLRAANNLSDLASVPTAQTNLALGPGNNPSWQGITAGINGIYNEGKRLFKPLFYGIGAGPTYPVGLRLDLGYFAPLAISTPAVTFGTSGLAASQTHLLCLSNAYTGPVALNWPSGWTWDASPAPIALPTGQVFWIELASEGTTDSAMVAHFVNPSALGVGKLIAGANITLSPSSGIGSVTIDATSSSGAYAFLFNVKNYGATGNGSTDDTAAIQACATAAAATPRSVIYFPDGQYLITSSIKIPSVAGSGTFLNRISVKGASCMGTEIIAGTAGLVVFLFDLTDNSGGTIYTPSSTSFEDLYFSASPGVTANYGINVIFNTTWDFGSQTQNGPVFRNLIFRGANNGTVGGYVNGLVASNTGNALFTEIYGYGNANTYDSGSGAGTGSLVSITGSNTNSIFSHINCDFWYHAILADATVGGSGTIQGILISDCVVTQSQQAFCFKGGSFCGAVRITNCQVDNGNNGSQSVSTFLYSNLFNSISTTNCYTICNGVSVRPFDLNNGSQMTVAECECYTGSANAAIPCSSIALSNLHSNLFGGFTYAAYLDAGCSRIRLWKNRDASLDYISISDAGTNNDNLMDFVGLVSWQPGGGSALVPGQQDFQVFAIAGVNFGMQVVVGNPFSLQDCEATGSIYSAGNVLITFTNTSSSSVTFGAAGIWKVRVTS